LVLFRIDDDEDLLSFLVSKYLENNLEDAPPEKLELEEKGGGAPFFFSFVSFGGGGPLTRTRAGGVASPRACLSRATDL